MDLGQGSKLITVSMNWIGEGIDYFSSSGAKSCMPSPSLEPEEGALPSLELRRYHNYRALIYRSSFGPGVFSGYDITLWLSRTNPATGAGSIALFDPRDTAVRPLYDDASTGVYLDKNFSSIEGLRLFDAAASPVVSQAAAVTAVVTARNGWTYGFEIIRLAANPASAERFARLVSETDRSGNAVTVTYQFAANASDAALNFDRTNLWKMAAVTDAYGRQATFTYRAAKKNARWVVEQIDLPNQTSLHYSYTSPGEGVNALVGLTGVTHPDGTESTFSVTPDAQTQTQVLHYFDAAGLGSRRKADVYLTNPTWVDPVTSAVSSQTANLTRMIVNGAGEVTRLNRSTFDPVTAEATYYVYEGGCSLYRYSTRSWGVPVQVDQAIDWDISQDPAGYTYEKRKSYDVGSYQRLLGETDALGKKTTTQRDVVTGALTKTISPSGAVSTTTYNARRQPLVHTDRVGSETVYTYDPKGSRLSMTLAQGTPEQGIWSYAYNLLGQRVSETDANGNITTMSYDALRYLASVTEPPDVPGGPQAVWQYTHDPVPGDEGGLSSRTDPLSQVTSFTRDACNRLTTTTYSDGSTETLTMAPGADANLPFEETDRLGFVTRRLYDAAGRESDRIQAFNTPAPASRSCTYLRGHVLPRTCIDRGERTDYDYGPHNLKTRVDKQPDSTKVLSTLTSYDKARRVRVITDPFGRRTYLLYDLDNNEIRSVQEMALPPPGDPPTPLLSYDDVKNMPRPVGANVAHLIKDTHFDAEGREIASVDGRGVVSVITRNKRAHVIRHIQDFGAQGSLMLRTEYDHDAQGNQIRVRKPRTFAEPGGPGFVTEMGYTGRGLVGWVTLAKGRPEVSTELYDYDLKRNQGTRTNSLGHVWSTLWSESTGKRLAEIDPEADVDGNVNTPNTRAVHGSVRDRRGLVTYELVAPDADAFINQASFNDPAATLREVTTRYDGRKQIIARTVWLVELGQVDPNDPQIAVDPAHGLTTRWAYDDNLIAGSGPMRPTISAISRSPWGATAAPSRRPIRPAQNS